MTNKYDEVLKGKFTVEKVGGKYAVLDNRSEPIIISISPVKKMADYICRGLNLAAKFEEHKEALRELVDAGKHLHADTYEIIEGGIHSKGDFIAGKILGHCQNVREENLQMTCRLANTFPILKTLLEEMNDES